MNFPKIVLKFKFKKLIHNIGWHLLISQWNLVTLIYEIIQISHVNIRRT